MMDIKHATPCNLNSEVMTTGYFMKTTIFILACLASLCAKSNESAFEKRVGGLKTSFVFHQFSHPTYYDGGDVAQRLPVIIRDTQL